MRIIFDFDGTVCDSMPALEELAVDLIAARYQVPHTAAREDYRDTIGLSFREQLDELFPFDVRNQEVAAEFEKYQADIYRTASVFPDVYEAFEVALDANASLAIVSSSPSSLTFPVVREHLDGYHFLVTGRESGPKVNQLKKFKTPQSVFIGDAIRDGELAAAVKIDFIGVTATFSGRAFKDAGHQFASDLPEAVSKALSHLGLNR